MRKFIIVAIDGAAASGKTSTSLKVAIKYNFLLSSTGLYYRSMALVLMKNNIMPENIEKISNFLQKIKITSHITENISNMLIDDDGFSEQALRSSEINEMVARYSSIMAIRNFLFEYQRSQADIAREKKFSGLIMEGRDITSVIFPDADLKFFLEANKKERYRRREQEDKYDDVVKRDAFDIKRTVCSSGVYRIDTGANSLDDVVKIISSKIEEIDKTT